MPDYKTPGVYVEEISLFPPSVAQVETAIPVFIGYTEAATKRTANDLLQQAVRIASIREYEQFYGGPPLQAVTINVETSNGLTAPVSATVSTPSNYRMYHALQAYFMNGGGPCYIISVGLYSENSFSRLRMDNSTGATPGGMTVARKIDEITLYVFPDAAGLNTADNQHTLYNLALQECQSLGDRFAILDVRQANLSGADVQTPINDFRNADIGSGLPLQYGAAYFPYLNSVIPYKVSDDTLTFAHAGGDLDTKTMTAARTENADLITDAFVNQTTGLINGLGAVVPASAFMAGVYARTDRNRGVWKAPANVGLSGVSGPTLHISHEEQMSMNVHPSGKSVNAIRSFTGKGTMVWGARTLAGNNNEWKYVSVRRFFNMVEESVKKASEQFVFEPNDANTWVKVRAMIENYLTNLWRQGALAGATPEQAFYVRVGLGETMTAVDILEGKLIVEIGMAAVRPAEFIILRFMHKMQEG